MLIEEGYIHDPNGVAVVETNDRPIDNDAIDNDAVILTESFCG